jgi:hypothetical protein
VALPALNLGAVVRNYTVPFYNAKHKVTRPPARPKKTILNAGPTLSGRRRAAAGPPGHVQEPSFFEFFFT